MTGQPLTFDATPEELTLFISEGEEQIEILSQDIIRLEHEGDSNSDLLQEIFRAAHTLKGSSGAIGHQRMAQLTHAAETVLDHVRHHTLPVTTRLIDLMLRSIDALRVLLEEVSTCVQSDVDIDDLRADLIALAEGGGSAAVQAPAASPVERAAPTAVTSATPPPVPEWRIAVAIDPACPLPSARALQIVLAAGLVGVVISSDPPMAIIDAGQVAPGATVLLRASSDAPDFERRLRQALSRINEVTLVSVVPPANAAHNTSQEAVEGVPAPAAARIWRVEADVSPQCPLPSARALQVALACGLVGPVTRSDPLMKTIEDGNVAVGAHLIFWIAAPAEDATEPTLRALIDKIPEVTVTAIAGENMVALPGVTLAPLPVLTASQPSQPQPVAAPAKNTERAEAEGAANAKQPQHVSHMVRIDVERLDALMNLVGELVIDRTRLARIAMKLSATSTEQALVEDLTETCRHLVRISDDLQDEVMRSRMLPIESVFNKFPRLVRDLAKKVGKTIEFIVEGKDTELDRSVAEQISDPIIHLLRNSIDHGIEPAEERVRAGKPSAGQVRLAARHEENQIVIDIDDDGRGINPDYIKSKAVSKGLVSAESAARLGQREAIELIFAPGFTTAEQISDISGRGVGMDIVRTNVERLNGSVTVETEIGQGTRFTVRLPLTLAIIRALLVSVTGQTFAIPLTSVIEALRIEQSEIRKVNRREAIELRGQVLPLLRLSQILAGMSHDLIHPDEAPERCFVVAVRWGDRHGGLVVDSLIGEQEIVIKSLGPLFREAHGISGGAVLGDGQVAPILDITALLKHIIASDSLARMPHEVHA